MLEVLPLTPWSYLHPNRGPIVRTYPCATIRSILPVPIPTRWANAQGEYERKWQEGHFPHFNYLRGPSQIPHYAGCGKIGSPVSRCRRQRFS